MKFAALLLLLAPSAAAEEERVERKRTPGARRTQTDGMSPWNMNPDATVAGAPHEVHQFNQAKFYDEPLWACRFDTIADAVGCLACANPRPEGGEALIVDIWAMYKRTNFFGDYNAGGGGGDDGCDCGAWGSLSMSMSGSMSASMSMPSRRRLDGHTGSMSHSMSGSMSMSMGDDVCGCGSMSMPMAPPPPPPPAHVIPVGNCPFCPNGLMDRDVAIPGGSSTCGSLGNFAQALPEDNALCIGLILPNAELCCPGGTDYPFRHTRKLDGHSMSASMSMSSSLSMSMDYAPYVKQKPRRHCVYPHRGEFWTCFNSNLVIEPDTDWLGDLGDKPVYLPDGTKCDQDQIDNDECYCYPGAMAAALPR